MPGRQKMGKAEAALRELALSYPEVSEHFPWGHRTMKVRGRAFIFMASEKPGDFSLSVKLPVTGVAALILPFATPTGYGLGKSGWVSAQFGRGEKPPLELLRSWLDESYRAIAPKKLVAGLPVSPPAGPRRRSGRPG